MFIFVIVTVLLAWITYKWYVSSQTVGDYGSRYVFITGCDSGFGNMLTKKLDAMGFNIISGCLTQKGMEQLNEETSDKVKVVQLDVTKTDSIIAACETVKSFIPKDKGLWGLVNNAGIAGPIGPLQWFSREDYMLPLEINTLGIVETSRIFLPMVIKAKGRIVNITSVMGRIAAATGPYVIAKYAAEGFSDILRREVYKRGVTVHILEPGYFCTNLSNPDIICKSAETKFKNLSKAEQTYFGDSYIEKMTDQIRDGINKAASPKVHLVVDAYVHALTSKGPKYRYIVGNDARFVFQVLWHLPEWISDFILSRSMQIPAAER